MKTKYQIRKYGNGDFVPGKMIPYFWSWSRVFSSYEEALQELNNHIKLEEEQEKRNKVEVVYEVEV